MLDREVKDRVRAALPALIERGRMGDQNALALLSGLYRSKDSSELARFSHETALSLVRQYPKSTAGIAVIGEECRELILTPVLLNCSPLAIALAIYQNDDRLVIEGLSSEVERYLDSLRQLGSGNFERFPLIRYEMGV